MHAYCFSVASLNLLSNYVSNRKQRTKIDSSFSSWADIVFGVPQGSILGPFRLIFTLMKILFFSEETDIVNYADDIRHIYSVKSPPK